jgi:hypothetical protein
MINEEKRADLDRQRMRDIGLLLGFFAAYSALQTGMATYHSEYEMATLCDPNVLGDTRLLKRTKEPLEPHVLYLNEGDCNSLYTEGWNEGHAQGTLAYKTQDLELIGNIARLAGRLAPFYATHTTAENDARDCRVLGDARTHFITNWRQTGGDKRRRKGI